MPVGEGAAAQNEACGSEFDGFKGVAARVAPERTTREDMPDETHYAQWPESERCAETQVFPRLHHLACILHAMRDLDAGDTVGRIGDQILSWSRESLVLSGRGMPNFTILHDSSLRICGEAYAEAHAARGPRCGNFGGSFLSVQGHVWEDVLAIFAPGRQLAGLGAELEQCTPEFVWSLAAPCTFLRAPQTPRPARRGARW